jgi:hypothetical protein
LKTVSGTPFFWRKTTKLVNRALEHKFGAEELEMPGAIAPRVLKGLLDEGSYVEDEVGAEYFAGVIGGSRSEDGNDDSGVTLIEVMNGLSSVQLRAHYVLYAAAHQVAEHRQVNLHAGLDQDEWRRLAVPTLEFHTATAGDDPTKWDDVLGQIMRGLKRNDLIDASSGWISGEPKVLRTRERDAQWPCPAIVFSVTNFGICRRRCKTHPPSPVEK